MSEQDWLAERFESHRPHLRAVAYRMLGSVSEAEDAVQETWVRLYRSAADDVENLGGWLTTVVGRVCLDTLRRRRSRREEPLEPYVPDPIVELVEDHDPEQQALLAESVGLALLVVLDTLSPAERLAFVLHDMFGLPFDEIAPIVDRTPGTAMQLASRARRRVRGATPVPDHDLSRQRRVVEAYLAASRRGDFEALMAVLDPEVVLRADYGRFDPGMPRSVRGARAVTRQALLFSRTGATARLTVVNGAIGALVDMNESLFAVVTFTITNERIVEINILADPDRLSGLEMPIDA